MPRHERLAIGTLARIIEESAEIIVVGILTAVSGLIVALRMHDATWQRNRALAQTH
jgi:hypothetical protein